VSERLVHCYIYYRVAAPHAVAARTALRATLHALEERLGIVGHLFEGEAEPLLWMEVYENLSDTQRFETALNALLANHRFDALLAPGCVRRIERFVVQAP
jgi:hypothetical protein